METHKLAIVIPFFKIDFFEETLKSLEAQTNKRFRVYIGNDCGPDNPETLLSKYSDTLSFVYKKFDANLGSRHLTRQWDRCIALSSDEPWLMVLCDDDKLSENCVEKFYENLEEIEKHRIRVIKFSTVEIDEKGNEISQKYTHPILEKSTTAYYKKLIGVGRSSLSEYVFSHKSYLKYGFREFPLAFGSDNVAWIEFSECGLLYAINDATVYFRISDFNISGNQNFAKQKKLFAMYLTKKYLLNNYAENFSDIELKEIIRLGLSNLNSSRRRKYLERAWYLIKYVFWIPIKRRFSK